MDVSEDGTVTGSIDVAALDDVEPKTDEAKAQHEALKAAAKAEAEAEKDAEQQAKEEAKADEKAEPEYKAPAKKAAASHSPTDKA